MEHYNWIKPEIKIDNRTEYRTDDLRRIFWAVLRDYHRRVYDRPRTVHVTCEYRRFKDGFCGGYAYYNSGTVTMKLPKELTGYGGESAVARIARTFHHELDHCRGRRHGEMEPDRNRDVSCVEGLELRRKAPAKAKPKATPDDKLEAMVTRRKRWESKAKRCTTAIRKLNRQIKAMERRRAALNRPLALSPPAYV